MLRLELFCLYRTLPATVAVCRVQLAVLERWLKSRHVNGLASLTTAHLLGVMDPAVCHERREVATRRDLGRAIWADPMGECLAT